MFLFDVWQGTVFVSQGCHSKLPQAGYIMTTEVYFCAFLEARSLRSRCLQDWLLSGGSEGETLPLMRLPWLLAAASSPWLPLAHGLTLPIPHCIFTGPSPLCLCPSLSLVRIRSLDSGPIITQYSLTSILTTVKSAKPPIFKWCHILRWLWILGWHYSTNFTFSKGRLVVSVVFLHSPFFAYTWDTLARVKRSGSGSGLLFHWSVSSTVSVMIRSRMFWYIVNSSSTPQGCSLFKYFLVILAHVL